MALNNLEPDFSEAIRIKEIYGEEILRKANVIGIAVGTMIRRGQVEIQTGLIVLVSQKIPKSRLDPQDVIPRELEGIPVDVQEAGNFSALQGAVG